MEPECIVFDEPTSMLDPRGRKEVLSVIKQLNAKGITTVLITHFMEEAAQADKVIVMDTGKIVMEGTPQEIFTRADELMDLSLGTPPAVAGAPIQSHCGAPKRLLPLLHFHCAPRYTWNTTAHHRV